jgi:type I phosphodiesterase/nucleotide pyrophosphatase
MPCQWDEAFSRSKTMKSLNRFFTSRSSFVYDLGQDFSQLTGKVSTEDRMWQSSHRWRLAIGLTVFFVVEFTGAVARAQSAHNVILFIPDGLRPGSVSPQTAPTFARVRDQGVRFTNSHSVFPTLTMVNAAAMGTGHFPGDTGSFANTIYTGFPVESANGSPAPMIENDAILTDINARFSDNYLNEETLLAAARKRGFLTAAVGKVGPIMVYDVTERSGQQTIVIDDATGLPEACR